MASCPIHMPSSWFKRIFLSPRTRWNRTLMPNTGRIGTVIIACKRFSISSWEPVFMPLDTHCGLVRCHFCWKTWHWRHSRRASTLMWYMDSETRAHGCQSRSCPLIALPWETIPRSMPRLIPRMRLVHELCSTYWYCISLLFLNLSPSPFHLSTKPM